MLSRTIKCYIRPIYNSSWGVQKSRLEWEYTEDSFYHGCYLFLLITNMEATYV